MESSFGNGVLKAISPELAAEIVKSKPLPKNQKEGYYYAKEKEYCEAKVMHNAQVLAAVNMAAVREAKLEKKLAKKGISYNRTTVKFVRNQNFAIDEEGTAASASSR